MLQPVICLYTFFAVGFYSRFEYLKVFIKAEKKEKGKAKILVLI